jgi:hypothetical protein
MKAIGKTDAEAHDMKTSRTITLCCAMMVLGAFTGSASHAAQFSTLPP